jgi:hypothetical protein
MKVMARFGEIHAIIDERADAEQRPALATVLYGGETDEAATHWWVFHAMSSTVHPPLFKLISAGIFDRGSSSPSPRAAE